MANFRLQQESFYLGVNRRKRSIFFLEHEVRKSIIFTNRRISGSRPLVILQKIRIHNTNNPKIRSAFSLVFAIRALVKKVAYPKLKWAPGKHTKTKNRTPKSGGNETFLPNTGMLIFCSPFLFGGKKILT